MERYRLSPHSVGTLMTPWDYVGTLFVLGDGFSGDVRDELEAKLGEICEGEPGHLLGGLSQPAAPGLIVKVVARSAPALTAFVSAAWEQIRGCLWKLPIPNVRRY